MASLDLPADALKYSIQDRIGRGAFSGVWKAICKINNQEVAIKIMDLEKITTSFEDILQEVQTMRLSADDNLLRCYCSFVHKDQLWLVTQLMNKGSCLRVMNVAKRVGLGLGMNEEWIGYIMKETLQGLKYLHDHGQIHRDIKSGNILLAGDGSVRLADFGVAGWTLARGQRNETCRTFVGTPCWMAPEVMEQTEGYDHHADIWSVGITVLELAKGFAPYARYTPMRVLVLTIEEEPPSLKTYDNDKQRTGAPFSKLFEDVYKRCLQKNPRQRPSADELLKHKFFKPRSKDRELLVTQLLSKIGDVNNDDEQSVPPTTSSNIPPPIGYSSASQSNQSLKSQTNSSSASLPIHSATSSTKSVSSAEAYVPGTTWVFDTPLYPSSPPSSSPPAYLPTGSYPSSSQPRRPPAPPRPASSLPEESLEGFLEDFESDLSTIKESRDRDKSKDRVRVRVDEVTTGAPTVPAPTAGQGILPTGGGSSHVTPSDTDPPASTATQTQPSTAFIATSGSGGGGGSDGTEAEADPNNNSNTTTSDFMDEWEGFNDGNA